MYDLTFSEERARFRLTSGEGEASSSSSSGSESESAAFFLRKLFEALVGFTRLRGVAFGVEICFLGVAFAGVDLVLPVDFLETLLKYF
jgi:hypothetical protein